MLTPDCVLGTFAFVFSPCFDLKNHYLIPPFSLSFFFFNVADKCMINVPII